MIRNATAGALALVLLATSGCNSSTPNTAVDAEKMKRDLADAITELDKATAVLRAMSTVPLEQRRRAKCAAIISDMTKAGFLIGGQGGDGLVSCRTAHGWSAPAFIKIGGGSVGLQAGVQSSDLLMLVMSDDGMRLFRKDFHLGADASVAAGPTGEGQQASTDAAMKAEILTYAKSRGLFAGVDVNGVGVKQNTRLVNAVYGSGTDAQEILEGDVPSPKEAAGFLNQLRASFP